MLRHIGQEGVKKKLVGKMSNKNALENVNHQESKATKKICGTHRNIDGALLIFTLNASKARYMGISQGHWCRFYPLEVKELTSRLKN